MHSEIVRVVLCVSVQHAEFNLSVYSVECIDSMWKDWMSLTTTLIYSA